MRNRRCGGRRAVRAPCLAAIVVLALGGFALPIRAQCDSFHLAIVPNHDSGDVSILDTNALEEVARLPFGPGARFAAATPDGQYAYVAGTDPSDDTASRIVEIDLFSLTVTRTLNFHSDGPLCEFEISPDGRYLFAASRDGTWDRSYVFDQPVLREAPFPTALGAVADSDDREGPQVVFGPNFSDYVVVALGGPSGGFPTSTVRSYDLDSTVQFNVSSGRAYGEMGFFPVLDTFVLGVGSSGITVHDVFTPLTMEIPLGPEVAYDFELLAFGNELFVALGNATPVADPALRVLHLNSGTTFRIPSAGTIRSLRYNPASFEVWTVHAPDGSGAVLYEVFDLPTQSSRTIAGLPAGDSGVGLPEFCPDYSAYFHPQPERNSVLVVDATTYTVVEEIPVGDNPRSIVMQGDTTPRESY